MKNFKRTGSISRKRGIGRPLCSFQQSKAVVTTNAQLKAHAKVSVSTSSVYKIFKSRKFYPYRPTNVQALSEADFEERVKFSNFTLDKFEGVLNSVLW